MKNIPLLSIVIPTYGTKNTIIRCLDSVLHCSYNNLEIIIVDDKANNDVSDIVNSYINKDTRIKYIMNNGKLSSYHTKLIGAEHSKGKYITFLDSDEHVSVDFYRRLIEKAEETDSDLVFGEIVLEHINEDKTYGYYNLSHTRTMDFNMDGVEAAKIFFDQAGRDFALHVMWNKIYRRDLWEKCIPYFDMQKKNIIMYDDIFYSTILWHYCEHVANIHGDFIYYVQNKDASTSWYDKFSKYEKGTEDLIHIFSLLESLFEKEDIIASIKKWEMLSLNMMSVQLNNSPLSMLEKRKIKSLLRTNGKTISGELSKSDEFYYSVETRFDKILQESLKKTILLDSTEVVSFDIFDTLIYRPFWKPTDLFYLLGIYVNDLLDAADSFDFVTIRVDAERVARERNNNDEDITLDDIYEVIQENLALSYELTAQIKSHEIELEMKYCQPRKYAKEIFNFALAMNKKVIITSDMYLSREVIEQLLANCGYIGYDKLFLSSEVKLTKASGNLFSYLCHVLHIKPERILHVGDNYQSDVEQGHKAGLKTFYFPKAVDRFADICPRMYGGESFKRVYEEPFCLRSGSQYQKYWGLRTMLAVAANEMFSNPYLVIHPDTDFNADPKLFGYYALGMHLFALGNWLHQSVQSEKYTQINFMARDGYLPKKAYEIIESVYRNNISSSYLHLTRSAVIPLQLHRVHDLWSLPQNVNIYTQTPEKIFSLLKPVMKPEIFASRQSIMNELKLDETRRFLTMSDFYTFLYKTKDYIFDKDIARDYQKKFGRILDKYFKGKTASVDVGYSCRIESILKRTYNYDVTPHYIHTNFDLPLLRAEKNNIKIKSFYEYSPGVTGILRELFISKLEPSCKAVKIKEDGTVEIEFKEYAPDYIEKYVISCMQKSAIRYVNDIVKTFREDIRHLHYLRGDTSLPLEYYQLMAKYTDRQMFSGIAFEDDLGMGNSMSTLNYWNGQSTQMMPSLNMFSSISLAMPWLKHDWQRKLCLFFINTEYLKADVKEKMKLYPRLFSLVRNLYISLKSLYRRAC